MMSVVSYARCLDDGYPGKGVVCVLCSINRNPRIDVRLDPEMADMQTILRTSGGENPMLGLLDAGYHHELIQKHMRPYKIGWARYPFGREVDSRQVFTVDDVKWHAFRETGMYVIIEDEVYDFTGEWCSREPEGNIKFTDDGNGTKSIATCTPAEAP